MRACVRDVVQRLKTFKRKIYNYIVELSINEAGSIGRPCVRLLQKIVFVTTHPHSRATRFSSLQF